MTVSRSSSSCTAICWALAAMVGIGLAIGIASAMAVIFAVLLGLVAFAAAALFLQTQVCGLGRDHWGPFEGLKGVPGWDSHAPDEPPLDPGVVDGPASQPEADAPAASGHPTAPALLSAPRASGPDDLQRISGVGPRLAQLLNDTGIYHFDQIARLTPAEVAWLDERLSFRGRIDRDGWIAQARALADEEHAGA
ncbi:hypothetical protein [Paracoccus spongiarum]|uniref:NADH:ubiquinone oxidoreductase n=1 Tax=Paracoccus spongiarum TaxID=3064387 RepID=A0ABT9JBZ4_9RHOB|nr:hypothetical protein [Paracoccus sp. 2205BS29-5]MDP5307359.1 hypothetical protein [Paracoccus sp. 2205BS29-5]